MKARQHLLCLAFRLQPPKHPNVKSHVFVSRECALDKSVFLQASGKPFPPARQGLRQPWQTRIYAKRKWIVNSKESIRQNYTLGPWHGVALSCRKVEPDRRDLG